MKSIEIMFFLILLEEWNALLPLSPFSFELKHICDSLRTLFHLQTKDP